MIAFGVTRYQNVTDGVSEQKIENKVPVSEKNYLTSPGVRFTTRRISIRCIQCVLYYTGRDDTLLSLLSLLGIMRHD